MHDNIELKVFLIKNIELMPYYDENLNKPDIKKFTKELYDLINYEEGGKHLFVAVFAENQSLMGVHSHSKITNQENK